MTLQDYQHTPKTVLPQELVDGVFTVSDAPFVPHQRVVFQLARALHDHVDQTGAGEVFVSPIDVILDRERPLVLQPDVLFISRDRSHLVKEQIEGPPDLVVEVLSPNPRIGRLEDRVRWFAEYGVREVWVYRQPDRRLDIVTCRGGVPAGTISFARHVPLHSAVLPGFDRTTRSFLTP